MGLADRFTSNRIQEPIQDNQQSPEPKPTKKESRQIKKVPERNSRESDSVLNRLRKEEINSVKETEKPGNKKTAKAARNKSQPVRDNYSDFRSRLNLSGTENKNRSAEQFNTSPIKQNNDFDFSEEEEERFKELKNERRYKTTTRIFNILLVSACVYIVFLIYGVVVTNYHYNEQGRVAPQVMSVSDIREAKEFEIIVGQYQKCRLLYEKTLLLDYRLSQGIEDPITIAPEYEELLEANKTINVSDLAIKTNALEVNPKYAQIKNMLLSWVQNDIALYLQYISSAISQNNAEAAENALIAKDVVYSDFSTITQNVVTIGESIKGIDITEIKEWSPEKYIEQEINNTNGE